MRFFISNDTKIIMAIRARKFEFKAFELKPLPVLIS
jgi:hypothetical protein